MTHAAQYLGIVVKRYPRQLKALRCRGVTDEDIDQECVLGALKANHRYQPNRGMSLSSFHITFTLPRVLHELLRKTPVKSHQLTGDVAVPSDPNSHQDAIELLTKEEQEVIGVYQSGVKLTPPQRKTFRSAEKHLREILGVK